MVSQFTQRWRGILRSPVAVVALVLIVGLSSVAIIGPLLWADGAKAIHTDAISQGPSKDHLLGTDALGRDLLLRILVATRLTLGLALLATGIAVALGLVLGLAPFLTEGWLGGWVSRFFGTVVNIAVAFPGLLLAVFFAVIFGTGAKCAVLAIGVALAPTIARVTQTLVAVVASLHYVATAQFIGSSRVWISSPHVLPPVAEPLIIQRAPTPGCSMHSLGALSLPAHS